MKLLFDFLPLVLFFTTFKVWGIFVATGVAMAAGVAQIAYLFISKKKIELMVWINLFIILVFGGATIYFDSELFIKWKPTVLYWAFAIAIISANLLGKLPLKRVMGTQLALPDAIWIKLGWAWSIFFVIMGILNIVIAYHVDTDLWVKFKVFGTMVLMLLFVISQSFYLKPYISDLDQSDKLSSKDTHE